MPLSEKPVKNVARFCPGSSWCSLARWCRCRASALTRSRSPSWPRPPASKSRRDSTQMDRRCHPGNVTGNYSCVCVCVCTCTCTSVQQCSCVHAHAMCTAILLYTCTWKQQRSRIHVWVTTAIVCMYMYYTAVVCTCIYVLTSHSEVNMEGWLNGCIK